MGSTVKILETDYVCEQVDCFRGTHCKVKKLNIKSKLKTLKNRYNVKHSRAVFYYCRFMQIVLKQREDNPEYNHNVE